MPIPIPITLDIMLRQGTFTLAVRERVEAITVALFGRSGAGKTTILDAIAGFRTPDRGEIAVGTHLLFSSDRRIDVPCRKRCVGYVPQDVVLFPHLGVRANILYGARRGRAIPLDRAVAILEIGDLLGRHVDALSGGERQRVALARAIMSSPDLLLLDEPLAAVDLALRRRIIPCLQRIRDELRLPILYVSHDAAEVRLLADWVIAVERGTVVASGPTAAVRLPSAAAG